MTKSIDTIRHFESLPDDECDISLAIRDMLMNDELLARPDCDSLTDANIDALLDAIRSLDTDTLSMLRLDYSLCPMHACDYAICFDDDDDECAAIRACFPSHDT